MYQALLASALLALMVFVLVRLRKQTPKNPALAVFLAFVFGPFGHFYLPRSLAYVGILLLVYVGAEVWLGDRYGSSLTLAQHLVSALVMLFRVWKMKRS
jgi:hypothetical protein